MIRLLKNFKPSLPPVAVLMEPPQLLALRVASAKRDLTALVRHEEALTEYGEQYLPSAAVLDGLTSSLLTRLGEPRRLSVVLGDPFFRTQVLTVADLPRSEQERHQVILWHLRKTLNYPIDGVRLRYEVLEKSPGAVTLWLTLCAEESVKALEAAFAARGCQVGYVGSASVELFNLALAKGLLPREGSCLIINRTPAYISFLFTDGGRPVFFRSKEMVEEADDDTLSRVAQELRLTLAYHREKLGRGRLQKILLRRYPAAVALPLEEVVEEDVAVEDMATVLPSLPVNQQRGAEWLPLYGLLEGA